LTKTGQESDSSELIVARDMAFDITGMFAECTPTRAWNAQFGDKEVCYGPVLHALIRA
jgi:hypothetical protein